MSLVELNELAL